MAFDHDSQQIPLCILPLAVRRGARPTFCGGPVFGVH